MKALVSTSTDGSGLEILTRQECLRLLASAHIGRVALSIEALPVILPVNFTVFEEQVIFRTAPGSKLTAAARSAVVAFEVDRIDPMQHEGWSVLVTGHAHEVVDPERIAILEHLPLRPWAPGSRDHFISIDTDRMSGRRLHTGASAAVG
ncbi:MAG: pyridoxamine 5'-phosphate oxidase family protein [Acidimicrobiia bacterium]